MKFASFENIVEMMYHNSENAVWLYLRTSAVSNYSFAAWWIYCGLMFSLLSSQISLIIFCWLIFSLLSSLISLIILFFFDNTEGALGSLYPWPSSRYSHDWYPHSSTMGYQ
ncbi:hypothetical protein AMTRI_Chr03g50060 [Amborella trichopoda]